VIIGSLIFYNHLFVNDTTGILSTLL